MFRVVAILAGAVSIAGCSDDASVPIDVGPTGPPEIAIVDPWEGRAFALLAESTGAPKIAIVVDPASSQIPVCVSLGDNAADVAIPMLVELTELELRQLGGCGNFAQCGHLALFVGNLLNNESAVPAIDLLTRKLGNPFHDGEPYNDDKPYNEVTNPLDLLRVRVELIGEDGLTLLDHDEQPLADDIGLITVPDCSVVL